MPHLTVRLPAELGEADCDLFVAAGQAQQGLQDSTAHFTAQHSTWSAARWLWPRLDPTSPLLSFRTSLASPCSDPGTCFLGMQNKFK